MNVSTEKLLEEIGRLHVTNAVLTEQLAASRQQLMKLATEQAASESEEPDLPPDEEP